MDGFVALASANLLSPPVLFFVLGFAGALAGSNLALPEPVAKTMAVYLMLAIGFKGGAAAAAHGFGGDLLLALAGGIALSTLIPVAAYGLLGLAARLPVADRAAVCAHYGSISIVTFVAASSALAASGLDHEGFMVAVAAVMETPAILVALFIAGRVSGRRMNGRELLSEVFLNSSIVVLTGAFIIGAVTGEQGLKEIDGFISDPFKGMLCLFLLDMGAVAGRGIRNGRASAKDGLGAGLIAFALVMPYISALMALPLGLAAGLSTGGLAMLMTLAASASYIAVPAAMRLALPEARPAIYLTLSLGVTFPMNLTIGIPTYAALARFVSG